MLIKPYKMTLKVLVREKDHANSLPRNTSSAISAGMNSTKESLINIHGTPLKSTLICNARQKVSKSNFSGLIKCLKENR